MFINILVSIDGSVHADRALSEAIDLAEATRARLTILIAVGHPPASSYYGAASAYAGDWTAALEHEAEKILACAIDRVPEAVPLIVHADDAADEADSGEPT